MNRLSIKPGLLCALFTVLMTGSLAVQADLYVIVHVDNPVASMSAEQIERLFLMKTKRFDHGDPAEPVNQKENEKARKDFNRQVLQRTEQQLKYYWSRKMFSGSDKPPSIVGGDADVEAFVASRKGGVGYLGVPPKHVSVKSVLQLKDQAGKAP